MRPLATAVLLVAPVALGISAASVPGPRDQALLEPAREPVIPLISVESEQCLRYVEERIECTLGSRHPVRAQHRYVVEPACESLAILIAGHWVTAVTVRHHD